MQNQSPELITVKQVSVILGISIPSVWRNARTGNIPAPIKVGGATRWRASEIVAWIEAQEAA